MAILKGDKVVEFGSTSVAVHVSPGLYPLLCLDAPWRRRRMDTMIPAMVEEIVANQTVLSPFPPLGVGLLLVVDGQEVEWRV